LRKKKEGVKSQKGSRGQAEKGFLTACSRGKQLIGAEAEKGSCRGKARGGKVKEEIRRGAYSDGNLKSR